MEIKTPQQLEITNIGGEFETKKAGIDESSMPFLFEMMSKSLYSNPIGSIVREITSNCFDSHKEAGVDDPVIVSISSDEEGDYISFKDSGVGLSPDRIDKIYMNYFSSTKRGTNEQIGGFGLGSKTPLSYTDYFYINTVFDSQKYQYLYSKGETVPTLDKLTQEETTEGNGTEIKIYIKNYQDKLRFIEECKKQLSYFDNVYFIGAGIDNNYFIFDTEFYKFRTKDKYSDNMHIVYGKVAYPIDWDKLNISPVKIPVGVKFEIGELLVTPNRETLRYTDEIVSLVLDRVLSTIEALKTQFLDQLEPYTDLLEWLDADKTRPHLKFKIEEEPVPQEFKLYLTGLKLEDKIIFKPFADLGITSLDREFNYFRYYKVSNYFARESLQYTSYNVLDILEGATNKFMYIKSNLNPKEDEIKIKYVGEYLQEKFGQAIYLIKRETFDYRRIAELINEHTSRWLKFGDGTPDDKNFFKLGKAKKIYAFIKVVKDYMNERALDFTYEDIEVPEEYKKEFKKARLESTAAYQRKINQTFIVKDVVSGRDSERKVGEFENENRIIIYGGRKDKKALDKAVVLLMQKNKGKGIYATGYDKNGNRNKTYYKVIMVAEANFKYFKNYKNMTHVKDLYSDNRIFRQIATSFKIEKLFKDLIKVQRIDADDLITQIKEICCPIGDLMQECLEYRDKYTFYERSHSTIERKDLLEDVLNIAEKHNYFDESINYKVDKIAAWFKDVELLRFTQINDESLPFILKYLKEKKKKLNLEYYASIIHKEEVRIGQLELNFSELETFKIAS